MKTACIATNEEKGGTVIVKVSVADPEAIISVFDGDGGLVKIFDFQGERIYHIWIYRQMTRAEAQDFGCDFGAWFRS